MHSLGVKRQAKASSICLGQVSVFRKPHGKSRASELPELLYSTMQCFQVPCALQAFGCFSYLFMPCFHS